MKVRVLQIEDSEDDAELVRLELEKDGLDVDWCRVETERELLAALDQPWDVIISDFRMPDFDGMTAFRIVQERGVDAPFIFVSGAIGEDRAVQAMRAGARDYLIKGNLTRLGAAVRRELDQAEQRRKQRQAEKAARIEQRRLAMAVEASGAGVFEHRLPPGPNDYYSERWAEILGLSASELPPPEQVHAWFNDRIHPDDVVVYEAAVADMFEGHKERCEAELRVRDASDRWMDVAILAKATDRDDTGRATRVLGVMLELTERRKLEAQLLQSQKMEAVGQLAGGVAHDFNNLVTIIFSFGNFVLEELAEDTPAREDMQEVLEAATKASELTKQLLAFSRQQTIAPRVVNVNEIVGGIDRMLRRVLGADIDFSTTLASDLWNVHMDPSAFEQVLVNLAVNARDAMPEGGKLTIETNNTRLERPYAGVRRTIPAGNYVVVSVSDDGVGMDEKTQDKVFEPFFTTKERDKGTGLGLATCFGIIKQAGGYIGLYSEPGEGTTFRIHLPRVQRSTDRPPTDVQPEQLEGSETILIVEDDASVLRLALRSLEQLGYDVLDASNGAEALELVRGLDRTIDLLITDVVMPDMGGREVAQALATLKPEMRVLYMSGYTPNAIVHRGVLEPGTNLLQKPFTPEMLASKVRGMLDE